MKEPETIFEEVSPHGNLEVAVDQDDRVAYLYLRAPDCEEFGIKSCWIRNLKEAPTELEVDLMRVGIAPMLPKEFCISPWGSQPLKSQNLEVIWFPEGDGVALLENGEFLAVIPSWGGMNGFHGYARDARGTGPFCWGLEDTSAIDERIETAKRFWRSWDAKPSPWELCQELFLTEYERILGSHSRYYSIDGGNWPARALVRFDSHGFTYLLTIGISLRPQPAVEQHVKEPTEFRRFEFGACFPTDIPDDLKMSFASYLSGQATFPWNRFTFFAHGHTIGCDVFKNRPGFKDIDSLMFIENPSDGPDFNIPRIDGDKVSLLWTVPLYGTERAIAQEHGSQALISLFPNRCPSVVISKRTRVNFKLKTESAAGG